MPTVAQTSCPALTIEQLDLPTSPVSEPQPDQPLRLQLPPSNRLTQSADSVPRAKQTTWPLIPLPVHAGSVVGVPAMLRKPCQVEPLKRLTSTGCVLLVVLSASTAQTTPPAPSPAHPGADMVVAVMLANVLHAVPLNALQVSPPVRLR